MLQIEDRDAFIQHKIAEHHYQPPYFRNMEQLNLEGAMPMDPEPMALTREDVKAMQGEVMLVDVRSMESFVAAHLPGSLSLPVNMIAAFAGWLIEPEQRLVLVADDADQAFEAARHLGRIGFDRIEGYVPGIMSWVTAGEEFASLNFVDTEQVRQRLDEKRDNWQLLDVRGIDEVESTRIEEAEHVYAGKLPEQRVQLDGETAYTVMCGSGVRATIAASVLERSGCNDVDVYLGSMAAWQQQQ